MSRPIPPFAALSVNCRWPGFGSTKREARPWPERCHGLARTIRKLDQRPSLIMAQELGDIARGNQAGDLLTEALGMRRQALGLNALGWDEDVWEYVSTDELRLPDTKPAQWPGRTYVSVKLRHKKTGGRFRIGSSHFAVKTNTPRVSVTQARDVRARQAQAVVSQANNDDDDWPMLLGIDGNSNALDRFGKSPRELAKKYGWEWPVTLTGIDLVLANFGAVIDKT